MNTSELIGDRIVSKVKWRIVPFAFLLYFFNGMDRVNLGYAALTMNKALAISSVFFGTISAAFFIAYLICQIPSNIVLQRVGVNKLIPTITILWGAITSLNFFAQSGTQVAIFRFLLGVAEAGFFPGMIYYFTFWFPARERAQVTSLFFLSGPVSGLFASPISGWIVQNAHWLGADGWRWLFVIEGLPTIILGTLAFFLLKNSPRDVKWLDNEEKNWLESELAKEKEGKVKVQSLSFGKVIKNGTLWRLACIYMFAQAASQASMFWMPGLVKGFSSSFTSTTVGFLMMIPNLLGLLTMIFWGTHSDKTGERKYHTALPILILGLSFVLIMATNDLPIKLVALALYGLGMWNYFGAYWTFPSKLLAPELLAVGIALINSCSSFGGFMGNYVIGFLSKATGTSGVYLYMAGLCLASFLLLVTMKITKDQPVAPGEGVENERS